MLHDTDWTEIATADRAQIEAWWKSMPACNVGVLTDGHIVLDADDKNGKRGSLALIELGVPLDTLTVKTPSGGRHVYFTGPNRENSAGKLAPGLDVRSYHGYVIAPGSWLDPSLTENKGAGGDYVLEQDHPVAAAPASLVVRLEEPKERQTLAAAVEMDKADAIVRAIRFLEHDATPAEEGAAGDITTFKVAAELKDMGISGETALRLMLEFYAPRCLTSWPIDQQHGWFAAKVENAYNYGTRAPGAASPEAEFAGVKIDLAATEAPPADDSSRWFQHGDGWGNHRWTFYQMMPQVGVGFMIGQSQAGKTFVNIELARCLATGKPFFGIEPDDLGGTIMLFAGNEGSGLGMRLAALQEPERLPIAATEVGLLRETGALETVYQTVAAKMTTMLAEHGVPVRLVILETLSASGLVEDENDNAAVGVAMAALGVLSRRLGVFFLVSHHPPKNGHGERGAGAFRAGVDYAYEIFREGTQTIRELHVVKARDAPQRQLGSFTLVPVELGRDDRDRPITSLTVSAGVRGDGRSERMPLGGDMVVECIELVLATDAVVIDGARCVDLAKVEDVFDERWTGSPDRSNRRRGWKSARDWAERQGAIKLHPQPGGKVFASLPF